METLNEYCHLHLFRYFSPLDKLVFATVCPEWKAVMDRFFEFSKITIESKIGLSNNMKSDKINETVFLRAIQAYGPFIEDIDIRIKSTLNYHPHLMVKLDAHDFQTTIQLLIAMRSMAKYCNHLRSFKMSQCYHKEPLENLLKRNKELKELEIDDINIGFESLPFSLKKLILNNARIDIDEKSPSVILKKFPKLTTLVVKGRINYKLIQLLPEIAKQLKSLEIFGLEGMNVPLDHLNGISQLTKLEKLALNNLNDGITDDMIFGVATNCIKLQDVELNYCGNLTEDSVYCLLSFSPELRRLKLSGINSLKEICPDGVANNLRSLMVKKRKNAPSLRISICHMPRLKYLEIINCIESTDDILSIVKDLIPLNDSIEIVQRIDFSEESQVIHVKNIVQKKERVGKKNRKGRAKISEAVTDAFKLVWLYSPSHYANSESQSLLSILNHLILDHSLEYRKTRETFEKFFLGLLTHQVSFEMQKARVQKRQNRPNGPRLRHAGFSRGRRVLGLHEWE